MNPILSAADAPPSLLAHEGQARPSPLDLVFRGLVVFGVLEISALAYQLATRPDGLGVIGQPLVERALLGLLVAPLVLAIGAFLLWRVPGNVVPRFVVLFGVFSAAGQLDLTAGPPLLYSWAIVLLIILGSGFIAPSLGYLMMHFPTGSVYPTGLARLLTVVAAVKLLGALLEVLATPRDIKVFRLDANPLFVPALAPHQSLIAGTIGITGILLPLILLAGMASLLLRFRASSPAERQQIRWVIGGCAALLSAMLAGTLLVFGREPTSGGTRTLILFAGVALLLFVTSIAVAIVRYRLYGIERVLNRALVYGALTVVVAGIYALIVGVGGMLSQTSGNLVISLLATGLIAVLFQPLRERLQRGVNRLLYGERDDPYAVLSRLGERLDATPAHDAVLPAIVETVAAALKLPYAAIVLQRAPDSPPSDAAASGGALPGQDIVAATGKPAAECLRLPLTYQHETLGALLLAPRSRDEPFSPTDMRLLADIARAAGAAAHGVRLTGDLQRSRERLVTAREEERRRIRRNLHDGLGPALASLTLKLDAARNLADGDAQATKALLGELRAQTQSAIADIRRLVYDLRPPALDELGLEQALRAHAARLSSGGLQITVEAEPLLPLSAAAEVAAYRIVTEALTNVVHHAQARRCTVRLSNADGLRVEVSDDGRGLPPGTRAGVGLTSMRERAEELGGTFAVETPEGGGTRIRAHLPLPA